MSVRNLLNNITVPKQMVQDKAVLYYIYQIFLTNFIFNNVFLYKRDLQKSSKTL